ncbi:MAG: GDP-mannose 4,6-dehydratase, partial [Candidatus Omnitrophica bacterium]|nr:GDP-mannose 4,6-dehydratase [Candidatus Omnitrophota bacterium]
MNILVTGGAGFIGSHFIRHLLGAENDHKVFNFDNLSYAGDTLRLKDIEADKRYQFIKGDIRNIKEVEAVFSEKIDIVIHMAAESIPEDIYVPVQSVPRIGTRTITFGELWKEQAKKNKPIKNEKGEAIFLRGKQTKILSFLNGGQWMPVKAITRHRYKGKIIKLIQKHGVIKATPNHSIYSSSLELTNPHANPELLVIREINEIKKRNKRKSLALLEILAAYITEGNATFNKANGGYIIEINQANKGWIEHIGELIRKEFSLKFSIGKHKNKPHKDVFYLQVSNKKFFNYLIKNCGKYCDGKFFPDWIFDLEANQRSFFWSKLLEGDGTKDGRYSTTSYKLTNQISLLLTLQGKKFKVFECDRKNYKRSWEFKTELSGQHYGLVKRKKQEIQYEGWVYDLEVEKSHNFVCGIGNVVCHNTHVDNSIRDPFVFEEVNTRGTLNVISCARAHKVKRFIHISTDEVYGEIEKGKF